MKIRPVVPADVAGILDLFESVAAEQRWIATESGFDREQYREFISLSSRRSDDTVAFVALDGARNIAGHISAYREAGSDQWSLGMLVAKEHRRKGAGSALLQTLIDWAARTPAVPELYLEVFPHNEAALALYRRFGFVEKAYHKEQLLRRNGERWDTIEMMLAIHVMPPPKN